MKQQMILHIPHASVVIPEEYQSDFATDVAEQLKYLTDWYTDELFDLPLPRQVFDVSRIVCDVERFRDDELEPMSACGMGACYTHGYNGKRLRYLSESKREGILRRYYDPHHEALTRLVQTALAESGNCLIVDCHSFSPVPLPYEPDQTSQRQNICIGTDAYHTPPDLARRLIHGFRQKGYSTALNIPYAGTIVPVKYYGKEKRVRSVMIEVNRRLYLDETCKKLPAFEQVKSDIAQVLRECITDDDERGKNDV